MHIYFHRVRSRVGVHKINATIQFTHCSNARRSRIAALGQFKGEGVTHYSHYLGGHHVVYQ